MAIRIGFVGSDGSAPLGESLRPLLPAGATLELLSVGEAIRLVADGSLVVLIVALDGPSWHDMLLRTIELQAVGQARPVAVFGLVPRSEPAALVAAFEANVADVAGLPVDTHEVRARLAALVRRRQVAFARAAETRAAWRMAVIDPVTGLYNRQHLDMILPVAVEAARTGQRPLALLMVDLDALKPFNDRWGHAAGDRVLRTVADALKSGVRDGDTIARYGGDEIAVVMPDTDPATARGVAARLVQTIADTPIGRVADGPIRITISVGLATLNEADIDTASLLVRADTALYDAKRSGRNRVVEAA